MLIICATAFIAATTLMAKSLGSDTFGPPLHALQISHGRFLFAFIGLSVAAGILRPTLSAPNWRLHIARTSFGWAGVTLMFASVAYIPLADATAISFLNPVFGMMLAIPLLGEKVGRVRWSAAVLALIGAVVLLRPTPDSFQPVALLALGTAMVMGMELIFIKKLAGRENPFQIYASFVAPFSYATLIFASFYDLIFYNAIPDRVTVLGAMIIITGAIWLTLREARLKKPARPSATSV